MVSGCVQCRCEVMLGALGRVGEGEFPSESETSQKPLQTQPARSSCPSHASEGDLALKIYKVCIWSKRNAEGSALRCPTECLLP